MAAAAASLSPQSRPFDRRGVAILTIAHAMNDMNQSVVPAILPFLIVQRHLSYAAAGTLVLTLTIASAVVQPVFGYITDKVNIPWLVPGGMIGSMLGTTLLGLAPNYTCLILATLVTGIASACYHPEAVRYANLCSGNKRGTGMGFFNLGGNTGFATGPLLVTPAIIFFGLQGTGLIVIPGFLFALYLGFIEMRRFATFRVTQPKFTAQSDRGDRWGAFAILTAAISIRSMISFGIMTFAPLFFIAVMGTTKAQANTSLGAILLIGSLGTVGGGWIADRLDRRLVVNMSLLLGALIPVGIGLAATAHYPFFTVLLLFIALGFVVQWSSGVTIVLGQEYLPTRIGTASGVTFGLATSAGGFAAPFLGALGDAHGLTAVIYAIGGISLAALAFTLCLPPAGPRAPRLPRTQRQSPAAPALT